MAEDEPGSLLHSTAFWRTLTVVLLFAVAGLILMIKSSIPERVATAPSSDEMVETLRGALERRTAGDDAPDPRVEQLGRVLDEMEKQVAAKDAAVREKQKTLAAMDVWLKEYSEKELVEARESGSPDLQKKAIEYFNNRVALRNTLKEEIDAAISERNTLGDQFNEKVDEYNALVMSAAK